jgi:hypothetical protein
MRIPASKRLTIGLSIAVFFLLGVCAKFYWDYSMLALRAEFAREQIEIFDEMRRHALVSDVADAAGSLRYVSSYYPSGTKQIPGSRLDRLVERERSEAVQAIISHLRTKTRDDLGDAPERWIEKYAK